MNANPSFSHATCYLLTSELCGQISVADDKRMDQTQVTDNQEEARGYLGCGSLRITQLLLAEETEWESQSLILVSVSEFEDATG